MLKRLFRRLRTSFYLRKYKIKHGKNCSIGRGFRVPDRAIITFGNNVTIYPDCIFDGEGSIFLGDGTVVGTSSQILSFKDTEICLGKNVMIGRNSYIINANHGIEDRTIPMNAQKIVAENMYIGDDVWIGAYCMLIKGAKINNGCVLGAKALLNKEMPDNTVFGGIPAKFLKNR